MLSCLGTATYMYMYVYYMYVRVSLFGYRDVQCMYNVRGTYWELNGC